MEEKIIDMFQQILNRLDNIESDVKDLKIDVNDLKGDVKDLKIDVNDLKSDVNGLKQGQERIENKLDNMEVLNANRHIEINGKLNDLSTGLTVVEAVTGKNMTDIANIKLVK